MSWVFGLGCQVSGVRSTPKRTARKMTVNLYLEAEDPGSYRFFPPSSAMYMISCLKMNRFGAPSRVRRTMFLS